MANFNIFGMPITSRVLIKLTEQTRLGSHILGQRLETTSIKWEVDSVQR